MSRAHEIEFRCPQCGSLNRTALWTRVNAVMDPNLAERILDGSLFEVTCRGCQEPTVLNHSALFYDPQRRVAHLFDTPDGVVGAAERAETEALLGLVGSGDAPYDLRKVADLDSFKELVHIWRSGLDDAAMLLLKHALVAQLQAEVGAAPVLCSFDNLAGSETNGCLEYIVYQTETADPETLTVPVGAYADVRRALAPVRSRIFPRGRWVSWDAGTAGAVWDTLKQSR